MCFHFCWPIKPLDGIMETSHDSLLPVQPATGVDPWMPAHQSSTLPAACSLGPSITALADVTSPAEALLDPVTYRVGDKFSTVGEPIIFKYKDGSMHGARSALCTVMEIDHANRPAEVRVLMDGYSPAWRYQGWVLKSNLRLRREEDVR